MEDKIIRFSVSLPEELLAELDKQVIGEGYVSRSEFVRDVIREKTAKNQWTDETSEVFGVLTLIYDHHQKELSAKMIDIQHQKGLNILCTTHVHIDHHNCMETIMVKGTPGEIEKIAKQIGGLKGVKFSELTRTAKL